MKKIGLNLMAAAFLAGFVFSNAYAQADPPPPKPTPTPISPAVVVPQTGEVSRERREQAYAKLLEGQRYVWSLSRQRGQSSSSTIRRLRN